jgi:DNA-binding CsgD family transcriptional regulator
MMEDFQSRAGMSHGTGEVTFHAHACSSLLVRPLSPRQLAVLRELATGKSNKAIGKALGLSPETVKHHLKHVFERLGVNKRNQAIEEARGREILS